MPKSFNLIVLASLTALGGCVAAPAVIYSTTSQSTIYATYCSAGAYQCPVPYGTAVGTECACPGIGAPSYGAAR